MQFDNQKTRNVADVVAKILAGESAQQEPQMLQEELKGNQHKIDANKNNKVDAHDFKLLRAQKEKANSQKFGKDVKEEAEQVEEGTYKPEVEKAFPASGVKTGASAPKGTSTMPKDKEKAKGQPAGSLKKEEVEQIDEISLDLAKRARDKAEHYVDMDHDDLRMKAFGDSEKQRVKFQKYVDKKEAKPAKVMAKEEIEELSESHFKVGDKVKCKTSGMKGEVVKLDKEEGGEDEKYYTIKREDGKMKKMAPNELTKINEETEIDEAMFPGTKEYEKKFGQSPQQKLKKKGDTVPTSQGEMKKTEKGIVHTRRFSEMISAYQEQGLKYIAELSVEEEASQEEYQKEVKKAQNKSEGKEKAEVAKASVEAVKTEQTHTKVQFIDMTDPDNIQKSEIDLEERSLTEPEMKKKEEIVKSMKKGMAGFKARYGDRAKEVMYATATARAKGE